MAVFMLETEALTSASSSISSLASQASNLSSSVSGYDTSCERGFSNITKMVFAFKGKEVKIERW